MGVHDVRSPSQVARIAGRGALISAAALAVVGGSTSMAFAAEQSPADVLQGMPASMGHSHNATDGQGKQMVDEVINVKHKVSDLNSSLDPSLLEMAGPSHKTQMDHVIDVKHKVNDLNGSVDPVMLDMAHQMDGGAAKSEVAAPHTAAPHVAAPHVAAPQVAKGNATHVSKPDAKTGVAQAKSAPSHVQNGAKQVNTNKLNGLGAPSSLMSFA